MGKQFTEPYSIYQIERFAPESPGVYMLCDFQYKPLYIGQSKDIKKRLFEHVDPIKSDLSYIIHNVKYFQYITIEEDQRRKAGERKAIEHFKPPFNLIFNKEHTNRFDEKYLLRAEHEYYLENWQDEKAWFYFMETGAEIPQELKDDINKRAKKAHIDFLL